ncbi:MAG: hypothetical protein E7614_01280 [Ruminococcaceae bacterium]|nr:hypothetical protein [Oscillospiraceae bacterium]
MLEFEINATNVKESNIFLRKLWCELNAVQENGWFYSPFKNGNKIHIGFCNFGEVSFDYKVKGCINKLYIETKEDKYKHSIENAVKNALNNSMRSYDVELILTSEKECSLANISYENILIRKHSQYNRVCFSMEAYSAWDVQKIIGCRLSTILSILYEYTNIIFSVEKIQLIKSAVEYNNNGSMLEYDYSWIDSDEPSKDNNDCILLPNECLKLIRYVIEDDYSDQNIALLVASSRQLLCCANELKRKGSNPLQSVGEAEASISFLVSSFEPLSLILNKDFSKCNTCGALNYSILKKVKQLFEKYFDDGIDRIVNSYYGIRSSYLHEGRVNSLLVPFHTCYPQIDPLEKNNMLRPCYNTDIFLLEASSYVFRNLAHDYFSGNL